MILFLNNILIPEIDIQSVTNYLIVTSIVVLLLFAIKFLSELFEEKGRRKKPKSALDELMNNKEIREMKEILEAIRDLNEDGTDQDMIPGGKGEFGYDRTNPIPVNTIMGNITYLGKLRTPEGVKVRYERTGSTHAENINCPIDIYDIYEGENKIATLYLSPYNKKNSAKAPRGFKLMEFKIK